MERYNELDAMCADLHDKTLKIREQVELKRLRAVEVERTKWEVREEWLVRQLQELQSQLAATKGPDRGQSTKNYPQARAQLADKGCVTTTSGGREAVPVLTTSHVELQVSANESPGDHSKGLSASTATSDRASCLPATMLTQ